MNAVPEDTAPRRGVPLWKKVVYGLLWLLFLLAIASALLPALQNSAVRARQTIALSNARQIVGALRTYADDHDGKFPDKNADGSLILSANQAFRVLFQKGYLTTEQLFYAQDDELCFSAWTPAKPDDQLDAPGERPGTNTLRPGENHFAYVRGLTDASNAELPLLADGFTAPAGAILPDPVYGGSPKEKGGIWQGRVAIVVRVDQSAAKMRLTPDGRVFRLLRTNARGEKRNYFSADPSDPNWLQPGQGAVDPE